MCETVSTDAIADGGNSSIATTLVYAIAELEDVDPLDLDFVLADYVPCDELDRILRFGDADSDVRVALSIRDYDVVVHSGGQVVVSRPCDDSSPCAP